MTNINYSIAFFFYVMSANFGKNCAELVNLPDFGANTFEPDCKERSLDPRFQQEVNPPLGMQVLCLLLLSLFGWLLRQD